MNHNRFKHMLNFYPPYWGTGITVKKIAPDFREIIVEMKMRWYNRNYVKTHFGGSLYAMTDPFFMLMLMQILGKGYIVWDKAARVDFIKPGRGTVTAKFVVTEKQIQEIITRTADGNKILPEFTVDIIGPAGQTVAVVVKTLYIRKKP
jgi:acyl-coenzyme A thioesterase PaaI-like protein